MGFVGNLVLFAAVKRFCKSVKNWQSCNHDQGGTLFDTQCRQKTTTTLSNKIKTQLLGQRRTSSGGVSAILAPWYNPCITLFTYLCHPAQTCEQIRQVLLSETPTILSPFSKGSKRLIFTAVKGLKRSTGAQLGQLRRVRERVWETKAGALVGVAIAPDRRRPAGRVASVFIWWPAVDLRGCGPPPRRRRRRTTNPRWPSSWTTPRATSRRNPGPPCPLPVRSECPPMQYSTIGSSAPQGSSSNARNGIGTLRKQAASHRRRLVIILHEPLEQRAWFYLQSPARTMRDARYLSGTHRTDHWKKNKTTECVHH